MSLVLRLNDEVNQSYVGYEKDGPAFDGHINSATMQMYNTYII